MLKNNRLDNVKYIIAIYEFLSPKHRRQRSISRISFRGTVSSFEPFDRHLRDSVSKREDFALLVTRSATMDNRIKGGRETSASIAFKVKLRNFVTTSDDTRDQKYVSNMHKSLLKVYRSVTKPLLRAATKVSSLWSDSTFLLVQKQGCNRFQILANFAYPEALLFHIWYFKKLFRAKEREKEREILWNTVHFSRSPW